MCGSYNTVMFDSTLDLIHVTSACSTLIHAAAVSFELISWSNELPAIPQCVIDGIMLTTNHNNKVASFSGKWLSSYFDNLKTQKILIILSMTEKDLISV